jgi:hypothetical protein
MDFWLAFLFLILEALEFIPLLRKAVLAACRRFLWYFYVMARIAPYNIP